MIGTRLPWRSGGAILVALVLAGCPDPLWEAKPGALAPDNLVATALGDEGYGVNADLEASAVPELKAPASLRPCCAFGMDLRVELGKVAVPGVQLSNVIGPDDIGAHRYDGGLVSVNVRDTRGRVDLERNGLVYTCRGGFIDVAHVRDYADDTLFLTSGIARLLGSRGSFELPPEGGTRRILIAPLDPERVERIGRRRLAVAIGQWLAFQVSIWHEIATWYGYASLAAWPEKISAFSPEDLYSNMLGVKVAGGVILSGGASAEPAYNRAVDAWLERSLERLEAVSRPEARAAMGAVDGAWWNSERRIPDHRLTLSRSLDMGPELTPWLVSDASRPGRGARFHGCDRAGPPLVLRNPQGFEGIRFRDVATFEIEVADTLAGQGFPFPRRGSRRVTQDDFPAVITALERELAEALGPDASRR